MRRPNKNQNGIAAASWISSHTGSHKLLRVIHPHLGLTVAETIPAGKVPVRRSSNLGGGGVTRGSHSTVTFVMMMRNDIAYRALYPALRIQFSDKKRRDSEQPV